MQDHEALSEHAGAAEAGALQARLAPDFAYAYDWRDLRRRLRDRGLQMRRVAGEPALFRIVDGTRLCGLAEIGFSAKMLAALFPARARL